MSQNQTQEIKKKTSCSVYTKLYNKKIYGVWFVVVDKNKTKKFYEEYMPCDCDNCRNFILQIKEKYPGLVKFLEEQGVNAKKPFELVSFEQDEIVEYVDCQYLLFGDCPEDFEIDIDGVKITQSFTHLSTKGYSQPNFVLSFSITLENIFN